MKKTFTQEQIVATLRSVEGGTSVADACRKSGITEQTFYRWKRKFAGMGVAELRRLKQLEDENKKLKDINSRELLAVAPLILAIFVLGLAPNLLLNQMRGAVSRTIADMTARVPRPGVVYDGPIRLLPRRPEAPKVVVAGNAAAAAAAAAPTADGAR